MILFNRQINVRAERREDGLWAMECLFSDTVHEIAARFAFAPEDGRVEEAEAQFLRAPYDICEHTTAKMGGLIGITVGPGSGKAIREALGGCEGCEHLVEITLEAFRVFVQCRFRMTMEAAGSLRETYDEFLVALKDTCYAYSHPEDHGEIRWWGRVPVDLVDQVKAMPPKQTKK